MCARVCVRACRRTNDGFPRDTKSHTGLNIGLASVFQRHGSNVMTAEALCTHITVALITNTHVSETARTSVRACGIRFKQCQTSYSKNYFSSRIRICESFYRSCPRREYILRRTRRVPTTREHFAEHNISRFRHHSVLTPTRLLLTVSYDVPVITSSVIFTIRIH